MKKIVKFFLPFLLVILFCQYGTHQPGGDKNLAAYFSAYAREKEERGIPTFSRGKPYEDKVAAYIEETGHHVLYRATPVFMPGELISHGIKLEAMSVEDGGTGLSFHVFCHNVQPGVDIDYKTGDSRNRLQKYE